MDAILGKHVRVSGNRCGVVAWYTDLPTVLGFSVRYYHVNLWGSGGTVAATIDEIELL